MKQQMHLSQGLDPAAQGALDAVLTEATQATLSRDPHAPVHHVSVAIDVPRLGYSFRHAAGVARADSSAAMTPATPVHIASIGKTMTAVLILRLVEDNVFGEAGLDTTLAATAVLPRALIGRLLWVGGRNVSQDVTLRHLLSHSSGMRDAMVDDAAMTATQAGGGAAPGSLISKLMHALQRGDTIASQRSWTAFDPASPDQPDAGVLNHYLATAGLAQAGLFKPGDGFHYADTGFVLLALLAEHVTGKTYHALLREQIFEPLGMRETYLAYRDDPRNMPANRTPEADPWFGTLPLLSSGVNLSYDWGGGGQVSTPHDLVLFLDGLLSGVLFKNAATLEAMTQWSVLPGLNPPRTGVGLGLFRTAYADGALVGHSGAYGAKMVADLARGVLFAGTVDQALAPNDWHTILLGRFNQALERDGLI